ncbi:hypothetical protein B9Z55_003431 [Caenorhabditis nigoni]|uniref:Uncharacterized protein n=1 Tax=Caenorhabditis nigoni TaxID=1611254 RepID=A0A2G5VQZ0_9PELO|nr:hypothetical protein B9Z55_003431 [Caenorhabditis nigoni]
MRMKRMRKSAENAEESKKPQEIQLATPAQTRDASKQDSVANFKSRFPSVKKKKTSEAVRSRKLIRK